jgi:hypothetical protein
MSLIDSLEEFREQYFPKISPQAEYKIIKKNDSPQNNGIFNDARLLSLKESTRTRTGKEKTSLFDKYNPNPDQSISLEDYALAKESMGEEPFAQLYRQHVLEILNPTSYESQASFRYKATASDDTSSCDSMKPQQVSNDTWDFVKSIYDDICDDGGGCDEGVVTDCEGTCGGGKTFDCLGVCGGTAATDSVGQCCEPSEMGCDGKCAGELGISFQRTDAKGASECCETTNVECVKCTRESGESYTMCPEHESPGGNDGGGSGGGSSNNASTKICESMYLPPSNIFEKEGKAVKINFESVPELSGVYIPKSNLADSWILNSNGINIAKIETLKSFEGTCLIHWELSFKTQNGELVDVDSSEEEWDRKISVLSKKFSVSYPNKILQKFVSTAESLIKTNPSEVEIRAAVNELREYFDFWPDKKNILDFTTSNISARDSLANALDFVTNTLSGAYETQASKIRAEVIDYDYNVPSDDTSSEFCATSLSGGKTAFHWKAPLRTNQTGWRIAIKIVDGIVDINHDVSADRCGHTVTRNDSWEQIELMRRYSNGNTDTAKTLLVNQMDSCLESTICPSSDTKLIQKKLSFRWGCNSVFSSEVVTVDFSIEKDAIENYIDVKVLSSSTEYCDGADNIYFDNVKILDDNSNIEVDYTSQVEKYKYIKNDEQSSTFEVWLRIKHPTITNGAFEDFIVIQPAPTPTETQTQTQTQTNFQSSSLGNFKFYAMKEDLGYLETCSAGYFVLSLKKYNENNFVQQGTNKVFSSGSSGSNMYNVPFLTLGDEGSEIAIDAGDTIKLRYRAMPLSGSPYLGTGCYSFYQKPNKISIEHGNVEDTGATSNPVITGWLKNAELANSSSEAFTDFEYTFSESDGDKLTWCAVMKSAPITDFKVSGGGLGSPFYNFIFQHPYGNEITTSSLRLVPGLTYTFTADGISASHPFSIGPSYGNTSLGWVSGSALTGSSGTITVDVPSDYSGDLYYFCKHHTSMMSEIQILN